MRQTTSINRHMQFALGDNLFADAIETLWRASNRAIAVGLSGAQGSGKSTTAVRIATALHARRLRVTICALDDFYLTRTERLKLAESLHPLLATRGVPGTHDVALLESTVARVLTATDSDTVKIPQFDKAADNRLPYPEWRISRGASDVVLIEGWCIGARPQDLKSLVEPVNVLEREEDSDGAWRLYVNEQLANDYSRIFSTLDLQLMLRAPSFECVRAWRAEQEARLSCSSSSAQPSMDDATLTRFIAHYERITRWMLEDEPADLIADLDAARTPHAWRIRNA